MRDLVKDLEIIQNSAPKPHEVTSKDPWAYFIWEAIEGWPEAIKRAMAAEARVKELEAQVEDLDNTLTYMKAETEERVQELEAQCAAMRKLLELLRDSPDCGRDFCSLVAGDDPLVVAALTPDAGRNLLERLRKLEDVMEAATQLCAFTYDAYIITPLPKGGSESKRVPAVLQDLLERLKETLAALKEGEQNA